MKNIVRTMATKGILGFKKAVAMATRGILDFKVGSEQRIVSMGLVFDFNIKGKKAIPVKYTFDIIGQKEVQLVELYALKAQKALVLDYEREMVGQKSLEYVIQRHVRGFCDVPLRTHWALVGKKLIDIEHAEMVKGQKSKLIGFELELSSQKAFSQNANCMIKGGKQLEFARTKKIKGKISCSYNAFHRLGHLFQFGMIYNFNFNISSE